MGAFGGSSDPSGGVPGHDPARLQQEELIGAVEAAGAQIVGARAALVRLVREGVARGLHVEAGFSVPDWVRLLCPGLSIRDAAEIAALARAGQEAVHRPLLEAVESGEVPVGRAARIVRALDRVRSGVSADDYAAAVDLLAQTAAGEGFTDKDIERVCRRLAAACTSQRDQAARERAQHELRDLHESSLGDGSARRFVLTVGDAADHETVQAILRSPLAASASSEEREATGELDVRTVGQRRYDAFMTVLRRWDRWHRGAADDAEGAGHGHGRPGGAAGGDLAWRWLGTASTKRGRHSWSSRGRPRRGWRDERREWR